MNINNSINKIMNLAKEEVLYQNGNKIEPMHILYGILKDGDNDALDYLLALGIDLDKLEENLENSFNTSEIIVNYKNKDVLLSDKSKSLLDNLKITSLKVGNLEINVVHLLMSILRIDNPAKSLLNKMGVTLNKIENMIEEGDLQDNVNNGLSDFGYMNGSDDDSRETSKKNTSSKESSTAVLDSFCRNVTNDAENDTIDPVVGRDKEIKRAALILARRKKNNPLFIGEAGVGKTAIVEGIAKLIAEGNAPITLNDKKIYALEMANLVAGTKYRGQFEERMKELLKELKANKDVILFIDEFHTIIGAGNSSGGLDAGNILKPAMARGEIQIIAATTLDEYRENIEKDEALVRRLQPIHVKQPNKEETITILKNLKTKYEDYHKVKYTDEAIEECANLAIRYITSRALPDKAIDIMDEAGATTRIDIEKPENIRTLEVDLANCQEQKLIAVKTQNYENAATIRETEKTLENELKIANDTWYDTLNVKRKVVDVDLICETVSNISGIPVTKLSVEENKKLLKLEDTLNSNVIGQEEGVKNLTKVIKRNKVGISDETKPIGSFMFVGSTGVGKTHLAKTLAKEVFGSSDNMIRVDMSEFMQSHTSSKLIGSAPGYVGYNEGGTFAEKVRRNPYSVILLDEIEKAHPNIFNIFLQVLDDGFLTDSVGRKINFKNTIIIMTSNVGVKKSLQNTGIGFGNSDNDNYRKDIITKALKNKFPPEFLNRLDNVIHFNSLTEKDIDKIVQLEVKNLNSKVEEKGYKLKLTKSAMNFIKVKGYSKEFGARPLKRTLESLINDIIVDEILLNKVNEGQTFKFDYSKKEDTLKLTIID